MATEIAIPLASATMEEGTITEWLKQDGDAVQANEAVCLCETDKATLEIEAPAAGVLRILVTDLDEPLAVGTVIATVEDA